MSENDDFGLTPEQKGKLDRDHINDLSNKAIEKFFSRRSHLFLEEAIALSIEIHGIEETKKILKFHIENLENIY
jgi:hypothetical protein